MFIRYVMFAINCDTPRSYTAHTNKTPVEWFDWSPLKGSQIHSRRLARAVASKTIQELAMTVSHGLITTCVKRTIQEHCRVQLDVHLGCATCCAWPFAFVWYIPSWIVEIDTSHKVKGFDYIQEWFRLLLWRDTGIIFVRLLGKIWWKLVCERLIINGCADYFDLTRFLL